jgi:hypothetical protein
MAHYPKEEQLTSDYYTVLMCMILRRRRFASQERELTILNDAATSGRLEIHPGEDYSCPQVEARTNV